MSDTKPSSFNSFINTAVANGSVDLTQSTITHIEDGLLKLVNGAEIYPNGLMNISAALPPKLPTWPIELSGLSRMNGGSGLGYWLPITTRSEYGLRGLIFSVISGADGTPLRNNYFMVSYLYEGNYLITEDAVHKACDWLDDPKHWKYLNSSLLNGRKLHRQKDNLECITRMPKHNIDHIASMGSAGRPTMNLELITLANTEVVNVFGESTMHKYGEAACDITDAYVEAMAVADALDLPADEPAEEEDGVDDSVEYADVPQPVEPQSATLEDVAGLIAELLKPIHNDINSIQLGFAGVHQALEIIKDQNKNIAHDVSHVTAISNLIYQKDHMQQPAWAGNPTSHPGYGWGQNPQQQHSNGGYPQFATRQPQPQQAPHPFGGYERGHMQHAYGLYPHRHEHSSSNHQQPQNGSTPTGTGNVEALSRELKEMQTRMNTLEHRLDAQNKRNEQLNVQNQNRQESLRKATKEVEELIKYVKAD